MSYSTYPASKIFNDFLKFTLFRKVQEGAQNAPFDDQTRWFLANSLVSREGTVQTLCWQAQRQTVYGYTNKSAIRFGLDLKLYLSENLCISMTMHKSLTGSPQSLPFLVSFFPRKALLVQQIGRRRLWPNPKWSRGIKNPTCSPENVFGRRIAWRLLATKVS